MNLSVRQRLERLEQRALVVPITLTLADGSQRIISGTTRHWQRLNECVFTDDYAGALSIELEWLAGAVTIEGANHEVFALTQALLQGGVETEVDDVQEPEAEGTVDDGRREQRIHLQLALQRRPDQ